MISEYEFSMLKKRLENLVVNNIGATIKVFKEALPSNSPILENLLNIEGQHKNNLENTISNIVNHEDAEVANSQVRSRLITLIFSLELKDFEKQDRQKLVKTKKNYLPFLLYALLGLGIIVVLYLGVRNGEKGSWFSIPKDRSGYLLYLIPEEMKLNTETECVVRIAFDSLELLLDLKIEDVEFEQIGTSERMKVELLEFGSDRAFNIYNVLREDEQFIERNNYTEWKFVVEPLKTGTHNLILKVTVLKKIGDDYIPRNISFEQRVNIITSPVIDTLQVFQVSGTIFTELSEDAIFPYRTEVSLDTIIFEAPCTETTSVSLACCDNLLRVYELYLKQEDFEAAIDMETSDMYYNMCTIKFKEFEPAIIALQDKYLIETTNY